MSQQQMCNTSSTVAVLQYAWALQSHSFLIAAVCSLRSSLVTGLMCGHRQAVTWFARMAATVAAATITAEVVFQAGAVCLYPRIRLNAARPLGVMQST